MKVLLDPNAYSALLRGKSEIPERVRRAQQVTFTTADRFGRIAAALRGAGTPIPTNDIWIAAQAMETGADLLSYDQHFQAVAGLAWVTLSIR